MNNMLGPAGVDVRDFAIGNDSITIYAVPGNSITDITTDTVVFKSTDGGASWTTLQAPIKADLITVAPDDNNLVVIANTNAATVYISIDGGVNWQTMETVPGTLAGKPVAAILDIAISPLKDGIKYIAVAGKEVAGLANLWYYDYGSLIPDWHTTNNFGGIATDNETAAVVFSPSFSWDSTVAVVTDNNSVTGGVRLQLLNINTSLWNDAAGYADYPCAVVDSVNITRLTSASLALTPTFDGSDSSTYKSFIGITIDGDATANTSSGIYRIVDIINTNILHNVKIHGIAYNGADLVAGSYDATTVYRCTNPSSFFPTFKMSSATKSPSGDNQTIVAWLDSTVIAGTSGGESAFAKSLDNGEDFDDISLIDTTITNARDVEVSRKGDKVYLVTDNGTNTSLWRLASSWKRVLCLKGTTDYIVRIEPSGASVIYLAKKGGTTIYYNNSSGSAAWTARTCTISIQDLTVENSETIYILNNTGSVVKSSSSAASWGTVVPTTLNSGATIVSAGAGYLFVGSANGYVAYSTNGSVTWTMIPMPIGAGGKVQVIADEKFTTNKKIYAASSLPGQNIVTWTVGTSDNWKDIVNGVIGGGIFGLAITNDILYALEYNAFTNQSTLWRHIDPENAEASSTEWSTSATTGTTDIDNPNVQLSAEPRALKASVGKLWAVKINLVNKLYSYTDTIFDISIKLIAPAEGTIVHVNSLTGTAPDVMFSWERPTVASEYQLFIAYDEDFVFPVTTITVTMNNTTAYILVGPQQVGAARVDFRPGVTYYWRIRVTKPGYSQYSITRYFDIEPLLDASALTIVADQYGKVTGTNPTLSWLPLEGVTEYEFRLSDNPEMTSPILDTRVNTTTIKINITLEYGKTYFWQVRATKPNEGNWSALVIFTVADKPSEPEPQVTITEVPPIAVIIPPLTQERATLILPTSAKTTEETPVFLHIIMLALIALLVVVSIMITGHFPKQLFTLAQRIKPSPVLLRIRKKPIPRPMVPEAKPEIRKETVKPTELLEEEAVPPLTIEKSKESAAVIFAAKSFIWMLTEEKGTGEAKAGLSEKERQYLGNKLAMRIRDLTKRENLYIKHPQDAVTLLHIWAQYRSKDETSRYLTKTFANRPDNAIRLLNCYLPAAQPNRPPPSADDFTMTQYNSVAEVVDPDKVYAALAKVFKFTAAAIEEKIPIKTYERNLAFKFMRLHLQTKGQAKKS